MMFAKANAADRQSDPRPRSVSSHMAGLSGLFMLIAWVAFARNFGEIAAALGYPGMPPRLDGPFAALMSVAMCAIPMVLWSVLVDKVHRNVTTGIDWSIKRPVRDVLDISIVKLAGFWSTWVGLAALYFTFRWYWEPPYTFAMDVFEGLIGPLVALSIPYVIWVDRHLVDPKKDAVWHFGAWIAGRSGYDSEQIKHHLRNWLVKGFFVAFMTSILPGGYQHIVNMDLSTLLANPVLFTGTLIAMMFLVDVQLATVGYVLTMKPLDSHIRSANPFVQGWVAALACYPPFVIMDMGRAFDYHINTAGWEHWLALWPSVQWVWGAGLIFLTGIYAWATMAFGLRFSNLTNRGVITHGPYAWTKHPAYISKNLFWWLSTMPFFVTTGSWTEAFRNCMMLALVSLVYFWRAKTEEAHLRAEDPAYGEYEAWMARNAPITRFLLWVKSWFTGNRRAAADADMHPAE